MIILETENKETTALTPAVIEYKRKRRNEWTILYESLIFVNLNPGVPKTHLMYAVNLSFTIFKRVKEKLINEGLIEERIRNQALVLYVTHKGRQAITLGSEFLILLGCSTATRGYLRPLFYFQQLLI